MSIKYVTSRAKAIIISIIIRNSVVLRLPFLALSSAYLIISLCSCIIFFFPYHGGFFAAVRTRYSLKLCYAIPTITTTLACYSSHNNIGGGGSI